jgi:hypothetical protein
MTDEVGLPVEGLGALVTLVLSLLRVDDHVLLQAVHRGRGLLLGPNPTWFVLLSVAPGAPTKLQGVAGRGTNSMLAASPATSSPGGHWG